jgi:hypothetical protein
MSPPDDRAGELLSYFHHRLELTSNELRRVKPS